MGFMPLNWMRLWAAGEIPKDTTTTQLLVGTAICWAIAWALAYFLVVSARGIRMRKEREELEFQQRLAAPLAEIHPSQVLIQAGEKAYGACHASLKEVKTVGFSAGTQGVSVRVAKGVTLRTSGTRGKAVKGLVSVSTGELVITDRRIVFSGDRKSFAIPLEDLLGTTNYADGFGFSDSKSSYTLVADNDRECQLFAVALNKVLRG